MQRKSSVFECMLLQLTLWHCCFHLSEPWLSIKEAYYAFSLFVLSCSVLYRFFMCMKKILKVKKDKGPHLQTLLSPAEITAPDMPHYLTYLTL